MEHFLRVVCIEEGAIADLTAARIDLMDAQHLTLLHDEGSAIGRWNLKRVSKAAGRVDGSHLDPFSQQMPGTSVACRCLTNGKTSHATLSHGAPMAGNADCPGISRNGHATAALTHDADQRFKIKKPGADRARISNFQVLCRLFAAVGHDLIFDLLTLIETSQACLLNSRDMHEHVLPARIGLDEAVPLRAVEPLHGAFSHL